MNNLPEEIKKQIEKKYPLIEEEKPYQEAWNISMSAFREAAQWGYGLRGKEDLEPEVSNPDLAALATLHSSALTQMEQGWISVKDSIKPNVDEWVLCAINNSIICYLFTYREGRGFYGYDDAQIDNRITHWRPLPLPPMPDSPEQDKL